MSLKNEYTTECRSYELYNVEGLCESCLNKIIERAKLEAITLTEIAIKEKIEWYFHKSMLNRKVPKLNELIKELDRKK